MATAKMETAAQRYRRIKNEKEKTEALHDVECKDCGMVWKARKVGLEFWVASGILPLHMAESFLNLKAINQDGSPSSVLNSMDSAQIINSIDFSNKVVRHTAVDPKIVDNPKADNEIGPDEMLLCCYTTLRTWQMKGGDEAARLGNFPDRRHPDVSAGNAGEGDARTPEPAAAD
jgi:hypothetical protein